jgi:hypothetical protein
MSYQLEKTYFYGNQAVKLKAVWMENETMFGVVLPVERGYVVKHSVVKLNQLAEKIKITKRLNLTIKLLENNDISLEFVNYQVPEAEKELYVQTTIEVEVDANAEV